MTSTLLLVFSAIAPALFLLAIVSLRAKNWYTFYLPRPLWWLAWGLAAGVASAYLALLLETGLTGNPWQIENLGGLAIFTLVGVGLAEEGAKYVVVRGLLWRLKLFREVYDGVLLSACVGLGFGAEENIHYVFQYGYNAALERAFTAVPFHGMAGVILGYYLGLAKVSELRNGKVRWNLLLGGLGWVILAHGIYDFLAFQTNPIAEALIWVELAVLAGTSWRLMQQAKQVSEAWGGTSEAVSPTLFIAPSLKVRDPRIAGALGLIPGIGQMYNGEWQKGWSLFGVGLVNVLSLAAVWFLITFPLEAFLQLMSWGLTLGQKPDKFIACLSETPILWILGSLLLTFMLFGAWDAYRTALSRQFEYRVAPPLRRKFVQSIAVAYSGHLLLLLLVTLIPIFLGGKSGGGGSGSPIVFDLVQAPATLNGHKQVHEGKPQGKDKSNRKERIAQAAPKPVQDKLGTTPVPQPRRKIKSQQAKGLPRSYSDYLSWKIRQYHDLYFSQVDPDKYTVVRYVIEPDGEISLAEVLPDHSSTPPAMSELAAETIRDMNPLEPLPDGTGRVEVLELFWNGVPIERPGSLEERLSQMPDGRWVQPLTGSSSEPSPNPDAPPVTLPTS